MAAAVSRRQFLLGRARTGLATAEVSGACLEARGIVCRACGDACDVRAVRFLPPAGGYSKAVVDPILCTGCGACLAVCPVQAITLLPGRVP